MNKKPDFRQLLAKIKKIDWWTEEAPGVYQKFLYPVASAIGQRRFFHPKYLDFVIFVFENDFVHEESPINQKQEIYKYIYKKVEKDKSYLKKRRKESLESARRYICKGNFFEKNQKKLTNKQVWQLYKKFVQGDYYDYVCYGYMLECADVVNFQGLVKKEKKQLDDENIEKICFVLGVPAILSFMEKARIIFLEAILSSDHEQRENKIKELAKKYYWLENNYKRAKILETGDFNEKIKGELKKVKRNDLKKELSSLKSKVGKLLKEKQAIKEKYKFSQDLLLNFEILEYIGSWSDERKANMMQANHYLEAFCQEIAKRFGIKVEDINYYLVEEIKDLLLKGVKVKKDILKKRRDFSAIVMTPGRTKRDVKMEFYYEKNAKKIYNAIFERQESLEIRGQVASAPVERIYGQVQLVLDPDNVEFKKGRILLTTMTRPDFIPIARLASAIITDEGGITCHAAILAREMGVPCIIGTKKVTKVLKDGDNIEMDLKTGIIKLI